MSSPGHADRLNVRNIYSPAQRREFLMTGRRVWIRTLSCVAVSLSLFLCEGTAAAQGVALPAPEAGTIDSGPAPGAAVAGIDRARPAGTIADLFSPLAGDFERLASRQNLLLIGVGSA